MRRGEKKHVNVHIIHNSEPNCSTLKYSFKLHTMTIPEITNYCVRYNVILIINRLWFVFNRRFHFVTRAHRFLHLSSYFFFITYLGKECYIKINRRLFNCIEVLQTFCKQNSIKNYNVNWVSVMESNEQHAIHFLEHNVHFLWTYFGNKTPLCRKNIFFAMYIIFWWKFARKGILKVIIFWSYLVHWGLHVSLHLQYLCQYWSKWTVDTSA